MSFFKTLSMRYILILATILLPFQPIVLIAKTEKADSKEVLLAQIMKHMQGPSMHAIAKMAMGTIPSFDTKDAIIGITERRELQVDALAKKLDKAETTFGSVALAQSLQPVADLGLILQRQSWAKALLEDAKIYADLKRSLKRIKKSEHAILAYWDATQRENGSKLFARAESFYYAWLQMILGPKINDSKWALEASMIQKMVGIAWDIFYYFGLQQVGWDLMEWQFNNTDFSFGESVWNGLKAPVEFMIPWRGEMTEKIKQGDFDNVADKCGTCGRDGKAPKVSAMKVCTTGRLGDIRYFIQRGINSRSKINFGKAGQIAHGGANIRRDVSQWVTDNCIPQVVKNNTPGCIKNIGIPACLGYFDEQGNWVTESTAKDPDQLEGCAGWRNYTWGWLGGLAITYVRFMYFWHGVSTTVNNTKNTIKTIKELHIHTIHLARAINTAKELAQKLAQHPILGSSSMITRMNKTITDASEELKQLFTLLENDTFSTEKAKTHIFSRGNVLLVHRLMTKVNEEIVPLLQGLGELDALYAMVTNMKEMATTKTPFSFAEFVPNTQAMIDIEDGWLPLVRNAVPNTIAFGGSNPNKIVVTGPNGGGKSVFLKLLGIITIMAQSWGIVPGKRVSMTLFDGLRSCIHPEESLEHELSTFMAEKMRVDEIKNFVFTHQHNPQFKVMLLLDEPFRGTVDAESADRIYAFGKEIASLRQLLVLIATHVEKPVQLAQDTNGSFANYHVSIEELVDGGFKRAFKLEPGILTWWFTDAEKRSRFIDFVTIEKHKEQMAQMTATQTVAAAA